MVKSGRSMFGWPQNKGGVPPTLDAICNTQQEKVRKFVKALMGHRSNKLEDNVIEFLVANGIRFFGDFMETLKMEPTGKYSSEAKHNHKFVNRVRTV